MPKPRTSGFWVIRTSEILPSARHECGIWFTVQYDECWNRPNCFSHPFNGKAFTGCCKFTVRGTIWLVNPIFNSLAYAILGVSVRNWWLFLQSFRQDRGPWKLRPHPRSTPWVIEALPVNVIEPRGWFMQGSHSRKCGWNGWTCWCPSMYGEEVSPNRYSKIFRIPRALNITGSNSKLWNSLQYYRYLLPDLQYF